MIENRKEIKGNVFQVAPFMAIEALRLKAYLLKLFGPAIGELAGLAKGIQQGQCVDNIMDVNISADVVSGAIQKLVESLDEDTFVALLKRLFQNITVTYKGGAKEQVLAFGGDFDTVFNLVFAQNTLSVYPLIKFVLEVNYPDFFTMIGGSGLKM